MPDETKDKREDIDVFNVPIQTGHAGSALMAPPRNTPGPSDRQANEVQAGTVKLQV